MKSECTEGKRILFTTVYGNGRDFYDHFSVNSRRLLFRYSFPKISSFGLRFIKENIPEIDILEFPTLKEFKEKVRNYDIVGFSFYMNETHEILEMAKYARECGVRELWAGNYGAMTPEIQKHFDRVFIGYSEHEIAGLLGKKIDDVKHPLIVWYTSLALGFKVNRFGVLFTSRGCRMACKFCQSPFFCSSVKDISIKSIEQVLIKYKKEGITEIAIHDETFGYMKEHTEAVTQLLKKHGFRWFCMTRADILEANLDSWEDRGLMGVSVGIENFDQKILDNVLKNEKADLIETLTGELNRRNIFILGYYMIGFENETVESIERDIRKLARLELDINQLCVVTPLPMTPLWKELDSKYGIFERDYSRYDTKHLVWNHPEITPEQMNELLRRSFRNVYPRSRFIATGLKFTRKYLKDLGLFGGLAYMFRNMMRANTFDYFATPRKEKSLTCHSELHDVSSDHHYQA